MTPQLKRFLATGETPSTDQSRNSLLDEARGVILKAADIAFEQQAKAAAGKRPGATATRPAGNILAVYNSMKPGIAKREFLTKNAPEINRLAKLQS